MAIAADTSLGSITGAAHLSSDRKHAAADTSLGPVSAFPVTTLDVFQTVEAQADVTLGSVTGAGALSVFRRNSVEAATHLASVTGGAKLGITPGEGFPDYVETAAASLYGDIDLARGPDGLLVVAASDSRALNYVVVTDTHRLFVAHTRELAARPLAAASDANYHYVITEQTAESDPDGQPELIVYPQTDFSAEPVARERLPRDVQPRLLWAADDGPDTEADFLVIAGADGAVQIRKADTTLSLLAEVGTGVYTPRVVDVVRRADLERSDAGFAERVWHVLLFSERSARGVVLEYRSAESTTRIVTPGDANIVAPAQLGALTSPDAATELELNPPQLFFAYLDGTTAGVGSAAVDSTGNDRVGALSVQINVVDGLVQAGNQGAGNILTWSNPPEGETGRYESIEFDAEVRFTESPASLFSTEYYPVMAQGRGLEDAGGAYSDGYAFGIMAQRETVDLGGNSYATSVRIYAFAHSGPSLTRTSQLIYEENMGAYTYPNYIRPTQDWAAHVRMDLRGGVLDVYIDEAPVFTASNIYVGLPIDPPESVDRFGQRTDLLGWIVGANPFDFSVAPSTLRDITAWKDVVNAG